MTTLLPQPCIPSSLRRTGVQGRSPWTEEWQIFLRTTAERYPSLETHLISEHPWDNPEVTFTSIDGGSAPYLEWLSKTTANPSG
ncbi:divalent cation tolerance protein CutA [Streptosporangium sp. NBC_01469]|uniref:divalent cation tolerance protein CutA n=1 Tax=Streptosporangium sp. NBC_01469 TaxID=2903898 RepID=UPI003FCD39EE